MTENLNNITDPAVVLDESVVEKEKERDEKKEMTRKKIAEVMQTLNSLGVKKKVEKAARDIVSLQYIDDATKLTKLKGIAKDMQLKAERRKPKMERRC